MVREREKPQRKQRKGERKGSAAPRGVRRLLLPMAGGARAQSGSLLYREGR